MPPDNGSSDAAASRRLALTVLLPVGLLVQLTFWPDGGPDAGALARFDPAFVARSEAFWHTRYVWLAAALALQFGLLALLAWPPMALALGRAVEAPGRSPSAAAARLALGCLVAVQGTAMAFSFGFGHLLDREYGLTRQTTWRWAWEQLLQRGLLVLLVAATVTAIVALGRRYGPRWWLPTTLGLATLTLLLVTLQPVLFDPLFYRVQPLALHPGSEPLQELARKAGFPVERIWVADASRHSERANAFINGLGKTERIVLFDTLIDRAHTDETALVLAHEIGHGAARHVRVGTALAILGLTMALALLAALFPRPGPRDVPAILLALFLLNLATLPTQNAISRAMESSADLLSLGLTRQPDAFIRAKERMAIQNLACLRPPPLAVWMFFTHPPVTERIGMALEFRPNEPRPEAELLLPTGPR
jgi:STE24 endopeptidase